MPFVETAIFPGGIAGVSDLLNQTDFLSIPALASGISNSATSLTLVTGTGSALPSDNFAVTIDLEIVLVGSRAGDTCSSLTRGYQGTTAASHSAAASVQAYIIAKHHNQLAAEINAMETQLGVDMANVQLASAKDTAGGYAGLDGSGLLELSEFPVLTSSQLPSDVAYIDVAQTFTESQTFDNKSIYDVWNGIIEQINDDDSIVPWVRVGGAFPNAPYDTRSNQVFRMGWNLNNGGGPIVSGEPAIGIEMEDYYVPSAGVEQMEFHIPYVNASAVVFRPFSFSANRSTDLISTSLTADEIAFLRRSDSADMLDFNLASAAISFNQGISLNGVNLSSVETWEIASSTGTATFTGSMMVGTSGVSSSLEVTGKSTQGPNLFACNNESGVVFSVGPNGATTFYVDIDFGSNNAIFGSGQGTRVSDSLVALQSAGRLAFAVDSHAYDTLDTSISRGAAGVIAIGTGAAGSVSGTVQAASHQLGSSGPTWTSGSGVPSGTPAVGSLYSRIDGAAGSSFYIYNGTTWTAVA